jgi:hypothetical protein
VSKSKVNLKSSKLKLTKKVKKVKSSSKLRPKQNKKEILLKAKDAFVTIGYFEEFKKELNSKVTSVELSVKGLAHRMDAKFKLVDSRFNEMEARFSKIDSRLSEIEARFTKIDETLEKMMELYHRQSVKFEEQAASNKIVFDHLNMLYDRQEKLEIETKLEIKNLQNTMKNV